MIKINNVKDVRKIIKSLLVLSKIKQFSNKLENCDIENLVDATDNLDYELLSKLSLALGRSNKYEGYTYSFTDEYLIVYSYASKVDSDIKELYKIKLGKNI